MSARGYDGNIRVLEDLPKPKVAMLVAIAIFEALLIVAVFITIDLGALW
jgi:energy-coupling factor transporter transmembrane protein EcfT